MVDTCKHKVRIDDVVIWECSKPVGKGRQECNSCKGLIHRGKRCMPANEIDKYISGLEAKLKVITQQKEELHKDYTGILKSHAELAVSYKNLLEASLVMQMEKNLIIDPSGTCSSEAARVDHKSPTCSSQSIIKAEIYCSDCKKQLDVKTSD